MADPPPGDTRNPWQGGELGQLAGAVNEIRLLLRVLVGLATVILIVVLIAGIVAATTAGQVQQQLGIN